MSWVSSGHGGTRGGGASTSVRRRRAGGCTARRHSRRRGAGSRRGSTACRARLAAPAPRRDDANHELHRSPPSSLFLHDCRRPNIGGYTAIHLVALATFADIGRGVWMVMQRRIGEHRRSMWGTYIAGCLVAGSFALAPDRLLGQWIWRDALGWV